jgi:hypothetical protein
MDTQKPSIGRIVHFVQNRVHYAAIILKVWSDTCVNLQVFPNGSDEIVPGATDKDSRAYSVTYKAISPALRRASDYEWTWHWPEQV